MEKKLVSRELAPNLEGAGDEWCITRRVADGRLQLRPVYDDACGDSYIPPDEEFAPDIQMSAEGWQTILETLLAAWTSAPKPEVE